MRVSLKKTEYISCGLQMAQNYFLPEDNGHYYGKYNVPQGLGFNFELELEVSGTLDEKTGMAASLQQVEEILEVLKSTVDHKFINTDIAEFENKPVTLETLVVFLKSVFDKNCGQCTFKFEALKLTKRGDRSICYLSSGKIVRSYFFELSLLHRHHNSVLTVEENKKLYGKCSEIHGHSYTVDLKLSGPIHEASGLIFPMGREEEIVEKLVFQPYYGRYLNEEMGNTSGELIVQFLGQRLQERFKQNYYGLGLQETRKNYFYQGELPLV